MIEYYKDSNEIYYRLICRANEGSNDGKEIAILQELNESGKLISVSYPMGNYHKIDIDEGIKEVFKKYPELNPKYRFPFIEYKEEKPELRKPKEVFSKSVQSMISLLSKDNLQNGPEYKYFDKGYFDAFMNDDGIEAEILKKISEYKDNSILEEIFHLIQIWGGSSGRNIYLFKNKTGGKYHWQDIEKPYKELVDACLGTTPEDEGYVKKLVEVAKTANISISNLGVSFITKHIRFWLYKNFGEDALPIYDSIMAIEVMRKKEPYITDLEEYWNVMVAKAKREKIKLMPLERQIFLYAFDTVH